MKKSDWIAVLTFAVLVVALEMVARGRRDSWWGWLLYGGSGVSLLMFFLGRFIWK